MVWPTDDLTTTHLDAGTDDPGQARAEIKACVDKLKTVLGEVSSGATVWHSGNDGGGSGLDSDLLGGQQGSYYRNASNINAGKINNAYVNTGAGNGLDSDLLDGQHGTYYQNASNLNAGSIPGARIAANTISSSMIQSSAVGQSEIAAGAVHQSELDTTSEEDSTSSAFAQFTTSAGKYGFSPRARSNSSYTGNFHVGAGMDVFGSASTRQDSNAITATNTSYITIGESVGTVIYAETTYVTASGPYDIGDGEIPLFCFVLLNSNSEIVSIQTSITPPWAYNGPTDIRPDRLLLDAGIIRKFKNIKSINELTGDIVTNEVEITMSMKNADMDIIPHPFSSMSESDTVIILDPPDTLYLSELKNSNESINELLHNDYLRLDNATITRATPNGVTPSKFKWKNTVKRAGESVEDRRLQRGPFTPPTPPAPPTP